MQIVTIIGNMFKIISFLLISLILMSYYQEIAGECCILPRGQHFCRDGTPQTPYCGYGPCNIYGCNCQGGCRR